MSYLWWALPGLVVAVVGVLLMVRNFEGDSFAPICVGLLSVIFGGCLFLFAIVWRIADATCKHQGDTMGVPSDYSLWTGCVVKVGDRWIPLDNYRGTEEQ